MQRSIRYAANVVCYKCGVPKVVCQRWSADGRVPAEEHADCQYFGVLIGVVVGVKHGYPTLWEEWQRRMQRRGTDIERAGGIVRVLGSEAVGEEGGGERLQVLAVLVRVVGTGKDVVELLQQLLVGKAGRVGGGQPGEQTALVALVVEEDFLVGVGRGIELAALGGVLDGCLKRDLRSSDGGPVE